MSIHCSFYKCFKNLTAILDSSRRVGLAQLIRGNDKSIGMFNTYCLLLVSLIIGFSKQHPIGVQPYSNGERTPNPIEHFSGNSLISGGKANGLSKNNQPILLGGRGWFSSKGKRRHRLRKFLTGSIKGIGKVAAEGVVKVPRKALGLATGGLFGIATTAPALAVGVGKLATGEVMTGISSLTGMALNASKGVIDTLHAGGSNLKKFGTGATSAVEESLHTIGHDIYGFGEFIPVIIKTPVKAVVTPVIDFGKYASQGVANGVSVAAADLIGIGKQAINTAEDLVPVDVVRLGKHTGKTIKTIAQSVTGGLGKIGNYASEGIRNTWNTAIGRGS